MTTARYDNIANWHDERVRSGWGYPGREGDLLAMLSDLTGSVDGLNVCDPGCGQGAIARRLARGGASVVGSEGLRQPSDTLRPSGGSILPVRSEPVQLGAFCNIRPIRNITHRARGMEQNPRGGRLVITDGADVSMLA